MGMGGIGIGEDDMWFGLERDIGSSDNLLTAAHSATAGMIEPAPHRTVNTPSPLIFVVSSNPLS